MQTLFLQILNMSAVSSVVIAVVLLLRLPLGRAPKKYSYALWSVVGFRLCCPFSLSAAFSLFAIRPIQPEQVHTQGAASVLTYLPAPAAAAGVGAAGGAAAGTGLAGAAGGSLPAAAAPALEPTQLWLTVGSALWCAGVIALLLYAGVSYFRLRRSLATATRLEGNVWQSEAVGSPFLLGILRPRIYLPYGLEGEARRYVLEHERCHIRRGDCLIKLIAFLLLAIHWFNPLCWLAFYLMGKDMEMSCDEYVLSKNSNIRKAYSTTLLSFAANHRFLAASPLAFGETGVKSRIQNALNWRRPKTWVTLAAGVACIALVAACAVNPVGEEPDPSGSPASPAVEDEPDEGGLLTGLTEGADVTLTLQLDGGADQGSYDQCWSVSNAVYYSNQLGQLEWTDTSQPSDLEPDIACAVCLRAGDWSLTAFDGTDSVLYSDADGQLWLTTGGPELWESPYQLLRGWYDEVEYSAMGGGYEMQGEIVIPNDGQGYLQAAQEFCTRVEEQHLQATSGSKYCYTFVQCFTEEVETYVTGEAFQDLPENVSPFYLTTVFVPENEQALNWSMAGNTGEYTGSDPSVPEGAFEYYRCGYITLEEDGWHGELVGTGW